MVEVSRYRIFRYTYVGCQPLNVLSSGRYCYQVRIGRQRTENESVDGDLSRKLDAGILPIEKNIFTNSHFQINCY